MHNRALHITALRRKSQRRKYQIRKIKTKKSKRLRSNKGRIMVGGYGAEFTRYILSLVTAIDKQPYRDIYRDEDSIFHIVRNITAGTFTNKMNPDGSGFFKPGEDLVKLFNRTLIFYNWTKSLTEHKFGTFDPNDRAAISAEQVTLYRHVNISAANAVRNVVQPIPMSCTWDLGFAIRWMQSLPCCICEMTIPSTAVFLPLSLPPPAFAEISRIPLNQPQYEVTVAPCILTYMNTRVHNGVTIYRYNARTCENIDEVRANFRRVETHGCFM